MYEISPKRGESLQTSAMPEIRGKEKKRFRFVRSK